MDEAETHYRAAGMTGREYTTFEAVVALRLALEGAGFDELATPLRDLVLLIDRLVDQRVGRITVDPALMGGQPCVRGTRIPVETVVGAVAVVMADFPSLEVEDVAAALLWR